eukprot:5908025-Prorocentrum_lima.AAC.1
MGGMVDGRHASWCTRINCEFLAEATVQEASSRLEKSSDGVQQLWTTVFALGSGLASTSTRCESSA